MRDPEVVVVGSLNMDLVARAPRLPVSGETLLGSSFSTVPGGKGANQAVAAARLGARTALIGCVGDDAFGRELRTVLECSRVDLRGVEIVSGLASGVALIVVGEAGHNGIVAVSGANAALSPERVARGDALFASARMVVLQLETPLATVTAAAVRARALGKQVVLNPAPAQALPPELWAAVDYLVPNESEAAMLSGCAITSLEGAMHAAEVLRARGPEVVLITMGDQGVLASTAQGAIHYPAPRVEAIDTTGAGDTFIGGLCVALVEGRALPEAIAFAQTAAALSVTRPGAQSSIPFRGELERSP